MPLGVQNLHCTPTATNYKGLVVTGSACSSYRQQRSVEFSSMATFEATSSEPATSGSEMTNIGSPSSPGSSRSGRNLGDRKLYRKRSKRDQFTEDELQHLEELENNSLLKKLHWNFVFKGPIEQLQNWLYYFDWEEGPPTYGSELQAGLVQLWSTFIVTETLLAAVAIQPFVTPQDLQGWKLKLYGILWMLSLLADFVALALTTIFLGFLSANPGKLCWKWLCKIGALRGVPAVIILIATFMSLIAIGFTTFVLYGWEAGVVCVVTEVVIIAAGIHVAILLSGASAQVIESELK